MSTQETFVSHLIELRERLIRALLAVVLALVVLLIWPGAGAIYDFLALPLMEALPQGTRMIATGVITPFLIPLKVTTLAAFILALPYVLYQAWSFVAPGLYDHEKKLAVPIIVASTFLFLVGVAFCYYFVFGRVFSFISEFAPKSITPAPDIEAYFSFVLTMFVAFGVAFEIPVVVVVLVRAGIVDVQKLVEVRPYVILGSAVVSAVVTPPDAVSMLALLVPMCVLYEVGILFARLMVRGKPVPEDSTGTAN
jgi:sec-independent protein translocase protein TatC